MNQMRECEGLRYDIVIVNGRVMDPISRLDEVLTVAISNGTICKIAENAEETSQLIAAADNVLDAKGLVVAPGFINVHGHEGVLAETMKTSVMDGVTTMIGGNSGLSIGEAGIGVEQYPLDKFFKKIEGEKLFINYATYTGHNVLRTIAGVPDGNTAATEEQIAEMTQLLVQEMNSGSLGVSFGPSYHSGVPYEEMVPLAAKTAELGGSSSLHGRHPMFPDNYYSAKEGVTLAKDSGAPVMISHFTSMSTHEVDDMGAMSEVVANGIDCGLKLAANMIVHDAVQTLLSDPAIDKYGIGEILKAYEAEISDFRVNDSVTIDGKLYMKSKERFSSIEQFNTVRDLVISGKIADPCVIIQRVKNYKIKYALSMPYIMIENGSWVSKDQSGGLNAHPGLSGAFSRFLGRFVREEGVCDLMTALYKTSGAAALFLGLEKKGRVQEGCDADLVLFDPNTIIDTADYEDESCMEPPRGISHVIVGGKTVVENGALTGVASGKVIRRNWKVPGVLPATPLKSSSF